MDGNLESIITSRLLIGRARHLLFKARYKELTPHHISPRQANVLILIEELGDKASITNLAEKVSRSINSVSIMITRMEKAGFVNKIQDTKKSTQIKIELTQKGVDSAKKAKEIKSIIKIMSVLSEPERQQLILLLNKIIKKAEKYP